jgi:hypothetical protein
MEPFKHTTDIKDNKEVTAVKELKTSLHLNMAACYEKLQDWNKMYSNSNKALELASGNTKARFRKAKASVMGNIGEIEVSYHASLEPVATVMALCSRGQVLQRQSQRATCVTH